MFCLRPTLEFRRGNELVTHALASPEAIWFQGHFPNGPLLPGVAMMALVEESLLHLWQDADHSAVEVESYRRVRFRQPVEPGASLRVRMRQVEEGRLRFSVELAGTAACTGECNIMPQAGQEAGRQESRAERVWAGLDLDGGTRFCSDGATLADVAQLAARLCELSVAGTPPTVCVASEDRVEVAAAMLAALSGGIEVIFPPALSPEAVAATIQARPFQYWLGPAEWMDKLADLAVARVPTGPTLASRALRLADPDVGRIFLQTGGTTGLPQVWPKTARNLLDEVAAHVRGLRVEADDHILATVPPHHIYGLLFSLLLPLGSGATVERTSPFFPQEIAERVARTQATILVSTPAHLRALSTITWTSHRLRLVLSSGAPLAAADAVAFHGRTGLWPLEIYGSTETGGIAVRRQDVADCPWSPMPAAECRCESEVLTVRSPYVSGSHSSDFFHTADLAEIHADGRFDLLGRSDGIVKVGAQRVSLPGIEKALIGLAAVLDAVVLALPSPSGRGQEIVALVASRRSADEIGRELRERLPSPAWPRRLRCVPIIPTTPSGKRDRPAILRLLELDEGEAPSAEGAVESSSRPGAFARLRAWLRGTRLVRKAFDTPVDPVLLRPPSARIVVGLVLLGASYVLGWPAIALLGAIAAWLRRPALLLGGPLLYGLSWAVFAVGLVFIGSKSVSTGRAFGLLLVRRLAERYLRS
jgi:acyl-coenzyme A synthetase/AMP-(fatty) acid ligase